MKYYRFLFLTGVLFFSQTARAQFSMESYAVSMSSGSASSSSWETSITTGELGAGALVNGTNRMIYTGFIAASQVQFTFALASDMAALVEFYEATGGDEWTNNSGWTIDPDPAAWFGVELSGNRVIEVQVPNNNLKGEVPSGIAIANNLQILDLSGNELVGVPDLSFIPTVDLRNNKLNFENLIPNSGAQVNPQQAVGLVTYDTAYVGDDIVLRASPSFTHPNNSYQWKLGSNLDGETNGAITISAIDYAKMGAYTIEATNPGIPGLTLESDSRFALGKGDLTMNLIDSQDLVIGSGDCAIMLVSEELGVAFDTSAFLTFPNGDFVLKGAVLGDYLIGVDSDDPDQLETYYPNTFLWEEAVEYEVRERTQLVTLRMTEEPDELGPLDGDGVLAGILEIEVDDEIDSRLDGRRRVRNTRCHVRRRTTSARDDGPAEQYILIASLDTDENGEFSIEFLPKGTYRINFEFPGVPMDESSFVVFEISDNQSNIKIAATIDDGVITVEEILTLGMRRSFLDNVIPYPNPAQDLLNVKYHVPNNFGDFEVVIYDLNGRRIHNDRFRAYKGDGFLEIDIRKWNSGVYFLEFGEQEGKVRYGFRIRKD